MGGGGVGGGGGGKGAGTVISVLAFSLPRKNSAAFPSGGTGSTKRSCRRKERRRRESRIIVWISFGLCLPDWKKQK